MPRIIKSRWTRATPPTVGFELDLEERRRRIEEQRRRAKAYLKSVAGTALALAGTVDRIESYGAFIDGPWGRGLVHVSQMAARFVKDPREVVRLGQVVRVWVLGLDEQERVRLTMIPPNQR